MAELTPAAMLLVFIDETDTWGEARIPLYEAVVQKLFELGIDGATASTGMMGFGANRRLHRKGLFGVTDDRPVTIAVIDREDRLREVMPIVREMVTEGVLFLVKGEVLA